MKELIEWISTDESMPDDAETVVIYMPDQSEPEPVWLGWYDSERDQWNNVDACRIASPVTAWAHMPNGPDKVQSQLLSHIQSVKQKRAFGHALDRAIAMLTEDALELRRSHTLGPDHNEWPADDDAYEQYLRTLDVVQALKLGQ